jgi:hypothetical protein
MKIYKSTLCVLSIFSFLLSSCEKVIKVNISDSSPQIVIEGIIYDQTGSYTVKISKSTSLDDGTNIYPPISGALVIISDNAGNSDTLKESSSGNYVTSIIQGVPDRTYYLTVIAEGKTYNASSAMPYAVEISSITFENTSFSNEKQLTVKIKDPADTSNYYRIVEFVNSEKQESFNVTNDKLNEGKIISYSILSQGSDNKQLETGDNVTIWLESIDKGVYEYFREAGNEGGQSASPANPASNINNGALGYFNACSVRKKAVIVP